MQCNTQTVALITMQVKVSHTCCGQTRDKLTIKQNYLAGRVSICSVPLITNNPFRDMKYKCIQ